MDNGNSSAPLAQLFAVIKIIAFASIYIIFLFRLYPSIFVVFTDVFKPVYCGLEFLQRVNYDFFTNCEGNW